MTIRAQFSWALAAAWLFASACSSPKGSGATVDEGGVGGDGDGAAGPASGGSSGAPVGGGSSGTPAGGGSSGSPGGGGSSGADSGGGSAEGGTGNAPATGGLYNWNGDPCPGVPADDRGPDDPDCTGVNAGVEAVPVDLFIMMDRSVSMSETLSGEPPEGDEPTRWDGVKAAVQAFVQSEEAAQLGVGIQFFSASGVGQEDEDCNVGNYSLPAVPIGLVSEVGMDVYDAIDAMTPSGLTPTYPALQGALEYAAWHASQPGARLTMVALVTDGLPTECEPQDMASIAELAAEARADHQVLTFVIGLAQGLWNLDQIAQAGGTGSAFIIQEGDVAAQFLDVMTNITTTPLACEYDIPPSPDPTEQIDSELVQMIYRPSNGPPEEIPRVRGPADCGLDEVTNGGWFYDSTVAPTSVRVCPCTCARFGAGEISIAFGCEPVEYDLH